MAQMSPKAMRKKVPHPLVSRDEFATGEKSSLFPYWCNKRSQEMMSNIDKYVHPFYTSPMKLSQYAKQQGIS